MVNPIEQQKPTNLTGSAIPNTVISQPGWTSPDMKPNTEAWFMKYAKSPEQTDFYLGFRPDLPGTLIINPHPPTNDSGIYTEYPKKMITSEGMAYALKHAVASNNATAFNDVFTGLESYMRVKGENDAINEGLYVWALQEDGMALKTTYSRDYNSAADADQEIALALLDAHENVLNGSWPPFGYSFEGGAGKNKLSVGINPTDYDKLVNLIVAANRNQPGGSKYSANDARKLLVDYALGKRELLPLYIKELEKMGLTRDIFKTAINFYQKRADELIKMIAAKEITNFDSVGDNFYVVKNNATWPKPQEINLSYVEPYAYSRFAKLYNEKPLEVSDFSRIKGIDANALLHDLKKNKYIDDNGKMLPSLMTALNNTPPTLELSSAFALKETEIQAAIGTKTYNHRYWTKVYNHSTEVLSAALAKSDGKPAGKAVETYTLLLDSKSKLQKADPAKVKYQNMKSPEGKSVLFEERLAGMRSIMHIAEDALLNPEPKTLSLCENVIENYDKTTFSNGDKIGKLTDKNGMISESGGFAELAMYATAAQAVIKQSKDPGLIKKSEQILGEFNKAISSPGGVALFAKANDHYYEESLVIQAIQLINKSNGSNVKSIMYSHPNADLQFGSDSALALTGGRAWAWISGLPTGGFAKSEAKVSETNILDPAKAIEVKEHYQLAKTRLASGNYNSAIPEYNVVLQNLSFDDEINRTASNYLIVDGNLSMLLQSIESLDNVLNVMSEGKATKLAIYDALIEKKYQNDSIIQAFRNSCGSGEKNVFGVFEEQLNKIILNTDKVAGDYFGTGPKNRKNIAHIAEIVLAKKPLTLDFLKKEFHLTDVEAKQIHEVLFNEKIIGPNDQIIADLDLVFAKLLVRLNNNDDNILLKVRWASISVRTDEVTTDRARLLRNYSEVDFLYMIYREHIEGIRDNALDVLTRANKNNTKLKNEATGDVVNQASMEILGIYLQSIQKYATPEKIKSIMDFVFAKGETRESFIKKFVADIKFDGTVPWAALPQGIKSPEQLLGRYFKGPFNGDFIKLNSTVLQLLEHNDMLGLKQLIDQDTKLSEADKGLLLKTISAAYSNKNKNIGDVTVPWMDLPQIMKSPDPQMLEKYFKKPFNEKFLDLKPSILQMLEHNDFAGVNQLIDQDTNLIDADKKSFKEIIYNVAGNKNKKIGNDTANQVFTKLQEAGYLDKTGKVLPKFVDAATFDFAMPGIGIKEAISIKGILKEAQLLEQIEVFLKNNPIATNKYRGYLDFAQAEDSKRLGYNATDSKSLEEAKAQYEKAFKADEGRRGWRVFNDNSALLSHAVTGYIDVSQMLSAQYTKLPNRLRTPEAFNNAFNRSQESLNLLSKLAEKFEVPHWWNRAVDTMGVAGQSISILWDNKWGIENKNMVEDIPALLKGSGGNLKSSAAAFRMKYISAWSNMASLLESAPADKKLIIDKNSYSLKNIYDADGKLLSRSIYEKIEEECRSIMNIKPENFEIAKIVHIEARKALIESLMKQGKVEEAFLQTGKLTNHGLSKSYVAKYFPSLTPEILNGLFEKSSVGQTLIFRADIFAQVEKLIGDPDVKAQFLKVLLHPESITTKPENQNISLEDLYNKSPELWNSSIIFALKLNSWAETKTANIPLHKFGVDLGMVEKFNVIDAVPGLEADTNKMNLFFEDPKAQILTFKPEALKNIENTYAKNATDTPKDAATKEEARTKLLNLLYLSYSTNVKLLDALSVIWIQNGFNKQAESLYDNLTGALISHHEKDMPEYFKDKKYSDWDKIDYLYQNGLVDREQVAALKMGKAERLVAGERPSPLPIRLASDVLNRVMEKAEPSADKILEDDILIFIRALTLWATSADKTVATPLLAILKQIKTGEFKETEAKVSPESFIGLKDSHGSAVSAEKSKEIFDKLKRYNYIVTVPGAKDKLSDKFNPANMNINLQLGDEVLEKEVNSKLVSMWWNQVAQFININKDRLFSENILGLFGNDWDKLLRSLR